jgi:hypothetical protein
MPSTRIYSRSFAGGELSPEMFGRIDDVKFQTGAAKLRNFIATPQGPAENRPGTQFVAEAKDSTKRTRLIPFTYSTTQTMVLEVGNQYIRFHTQGATLQAGSPAAYNGATAYVIGDLVSSGGTNYYCIAATTGNSPPNATYWYPLPSSAYEIPTPYLEADIPTIHYVQSADVLTLVHPNYAPRELRRLGATTWTLSTISFVAPVAVPAAPTVTASRGDALNITGITQANPGVITTVGNHGFAVGDSIYVNGGTMTQLAGFYLVNSTPAGNTLSVKAYDTGVPVNTTSYTAWASGGFVQFGDKSLDFDNYYVVTAIAQNAVDESAASPTGNVINNLNALGAKNTISWSAVSGALRYNIYKRQSGLFGYIGQTASTSFDDDNIAPDMGITPPIVETPFVGAGNYPRSVSYFEQRRIFAGTNNAPQTIWMTRSGTESDLSYTLPSKDSDRINIRVAAREANTINHIVPLTQLLLLTSAAEWRVSPVNSDVLSPSTISVRPQSYIGANDVQPEIVNNTVVYCSARGGHVRELGYSWQASGFVTGDLSVRAAHLFDDLDVTDMCYSKSPQPILWFVSSNGNLLGLTYMPEQQIGAWHQHDTDGLFETATAVAEGSEDRLYVIVKRTIGGSTKRYVERMASRQITTLTNCFFVDCGLTYNGNNTTATTVTVSGGTTWGPSDVLTITASSAIFQFPSTSTPPTDINDAIVLTDSAGNLYRLRIIGTSSTTVATARVDVTLPVALRNTATTVWGFARDTVSGLTHLNGKTVSILADGAVQPQETVSGGSVSLDRAAVVIHVGLPYESDLQTLPAVMSLDGYGQGRYKNVNKAYIRVFKSSGIFIGPTADRLVEAKQRTTEPYGTPPSLKSDEIDVDLKPAWRAGGQVYLRQADPLPLTVVGLTLEVVLGD